MSTEFTYRGITFNKPYSDGSQYIINSISPAVSPPNIAQNSIDLVSRHGVAHGANKEGRRFMTLQGTLIAPNRSKMAELKRDMCRVLTLPPDTVDPEEQFYDLVIKNDLGVEKYNKAKTSQRPVFGEDAPHAPLWIEFSFVLELEKPFFWGSEREISTEESIPETNFFILGAGRPIIEGVNYFIQYQAANFIANNVGNQYSYPYVIIYGPAINPTVNNNTTGQKMSFEIEIGANEEIHVDTENGVILKYDGVTFEDVSYSLTDDSKLFVLEVGENKINIIDETPLAANFTAKIIWRDAYTDIW